MTEAVCASTSVHHPFPSIDQFRCVVKIVRDRAAWDKVPLPTLRFIGSVKLHGTNASVVFPVDHRRLYAQSRTAVITPESDNAGFARYVHDNNTVFDYLGQNLADRNGIAGMRTFVFYGEWCGSNIQKSVALNQLPKMFVVFAVKEFFGESKKWLDPNDIIAACLGTGLHCIYDFPTFFMDIDFSALELSQNRLSELTEAVERECPVGKALGVSGIGEGIVWWAQPHGSFNTQGLIFKVKGEKHSETRVKTLAAVDVEKIENLRELVAAVLTPHRLEKKLDDLHAQGLETDVRNTGAFLKIVSLDVLKEESDTFTASGLEAKEIMPAISCVARQWFMEKATAL